MINAEVIAENKPPLSEFSFTRSTTRPSETTRAIVQVQAILFASLVISLFSAFLGMFSNQWLNRYQSIDQRGSAIERSQSRQRKLDGIIVWCFNLVMDLLPSMLQGGLLLLGCALSSYLREVNIIVASVVLGVTLFGGTLYPFIIIAGTVSESCPYQTPGAYIPRHTFCHLHQYLLPTLYSAFAVFPVIVSPNFSRLFQASVCCRVFCYWWFATRRPWYSMSNCGYTLMWPIVLIAAPTVDAYYLGRATLRLLVSFSRKTYRQLMGRTPHHWFIGTSL